MIAHCRSALEIPKSRCAEGSAMVTTVPSSTTISWAIAITASAPPSAAGQGVDGLLERPEAVLSTLVRVVAGKLGV